MIKLNLPVKLKVLFRYLPTYLLLTSFSTAFAGLLNSDIQVKKFLCDLNSGKLSTEGFFVITYVLEKNSVFEKIEYISNGKVVNRGLDKLDACLVLDKNNWKCGGENSTYPNGTFVQYSSHQVVNGKYSFFPTSYNHKPVKDIFCKYEQLN